MPFPAPAATGLRGKTNPGLDAVLEAVEYDGPLLALEGSVVTTLPSLVDGAASTAVVLLAVAAMLKPLNDGVDVFAGEPYGGGDLMPSILDAAREPMVVTGAVDGVGSTTLAGAGVVGLPRLLVAARLCSCQMKPTSASARGSQCWSPVT